MKHSMHRWIVVTVFMLIFIVGASTVTAGNNKLAHIDPLILEELSDNGNADLFVKMDTDASLEGADALKTKVEAGQYVYDTLTAHAATSQADLLYYLDQRGIEYRSFWINNSVYITGASGPLVQSLAQFDGVAFLRGNHAQSWILPISTTPTSAVPNQTPEWGVDRINAPGVWALGFDGRGVVVGSIDSGTRYTHEALVNQYRGNMGGGVFDHDYNWFDPNLIDPAPVDPFFHGTHTMGTIVGDDGGANQIGVAPGAKWMTAGLGSVPLDWELLAGGQWIACPTRVDDTDPDCSKAPDVVNNSWGGGGGDPWYKAITDAWRAARIIGIFSAGNSGPSCNTHGSPGDYSAVISVGATDISNTLASFSSRGPGAFRQLKPDVVAPGANIRSALNTSDTAYGNSSGTSMAAPHVTGATALLLDIRRNLNLRKVYKVLAINTDRTLNSPPGQHPAAAGIMMSTRTQFMDGE